MFKNGNFFANLRIFGTKFDIFNTIESKKIVDFSRADGKKWKKSRFFDVLDEI